MVPVAYGYPGPDTRHRAERGEVVLGGCEILWDAEPFGCTACAAGVWWQGVFSRGDGARRLRLGGLEYTVHADGGLTVFDGAGGGLMVSPDEVETLVVTLALESFVEGEGMVAWLRQHHLDVAGDAVGLLDRFGVDDTGFHASGIAADVTVAATDRLLLGLLRGVLGDGAMTPGELGDWLGDRGVVAVVGG